LCVLYCVLSEKGNIPVTDGKDLSLTVDKIHTEYLNRQMYKLIQKEREKAKESYDKW
jgi:hypothetical protein